MSQVTQPTYNAYRGGRHYWWPGSFSQVLVFVRYSRSWLTLLCYCMSIATHSGDHCQTEAPCPVKDCATEFNGKQCNVRFATVKKMLMNRSQVDNLSAWINSGCPKGLNASFLVKLSSRLTVRQRGCMVIKIKGHLITSSCDNAYGGPEFARRLQNLVFSLQSHSVYI